MCIFMRSSCMGGSLETGFHQRYDLEEFSNMLIVLDCNSDVRRNHIGFVAALDAPVHLHARIHSFTNEKIMNGLRRRYWGGIE
jgi:hypothetical protein